ncbi:AAA-domain-containing protein [Aspergillus sclerotioniger CBS 115572]|uniref:AAA-domain-containing protein n=1 Tax=Aspergillus sclerotioniger CBS 115572 TaxID=1450535 RepID=A0A317WTB1_9EURO|nr:AAA-domain-containing protein [Aspergillus sclerotioniger CBS 115572]PWY89596.1 AAA-domain-containing protein [Aspergillus sclerotioniger CBS 115572]
MQVVGLAGRKGTLQPYDVQQVLARAVRKKSKVSDDDQQTKSTLEERLDKLKICCNKHEVNLFGCVFDPANSKVTYDDVIVEERTKETIKYLVSQSRLHFEASSQFLIDSTRLSGALFYGPPGTGKTEMARAIASDSNAVMLRVSPAGLERAVSTIKAAFTLSKKLSPCILFIDEADALSCQGFVDVIPWRQHDLTQYLEEMDGLASSKDAPFVLCATNKPLDLDKALLRTMPLKVQFKLPGSMERRKILEVFLKESDLDPSFDMDSLVHATEGSSRSDLHSLCGQAALEFGIDHVSSKTDKNGQETASIIIKLKNRHFDKALCNFRPSVTS